MQTQMTPPKQFEIDEETQTFVLSEDDKKKLLAEWNTNFSRVEQQRTLLEQQWYTNLAFLRGNQWASWVKSPLTNSGVVFMTPKSSRKRLVFNKIRSKVRNEFTKLVKEEMQYWVQPNTTDQSDVSSAKTAEALAEFCIDYGQFNKFRRSATWWAVVTGTGFQKVEYDPKYPIPGMRDGKPNPTGFVKYSAPSPFHLFVPYFDKEDMEDQPWAIQASGYDPELVEATYGIKVEPDRVGSGLGSDARFLQSINVHSSNQTFNQVYVKEAWIKPSPKYPMGMLLVWANNTILYASPYPFSHMELPFHKMISIRSGGFYGTSIIEDLIPMQKEYNLTRSQLAEARDLTSKPALAVVKGSVDPRKINSKPGNIVEVQPGADFPRPLARGDYPNYVIDELERTNRDMDDASGQYEVTQGRTPPGVEAASAIAYLQEENDTRLYDSIASIEEAVAAMGRQTLKILQERWDETRILNTISKTHVQGTIEFTAQELRDNTNFRVVPQSMAPRSRAAKNAQIMEYIKLGVIPPEVGLKHIGMSETKTLYDEIQVDSNQAQRENLRMARGEAVEPNEWDNDQIHVQEHENFMKSAEFELLSEDRQKLFIEHRQKHQTIAIAEVIEAQGTNQDVTEPTDAAAGIPSNA